MKEINKKSTETERIIIACLLSFFLILLSTFVIATPTGPSGIDVTSNETKATTNGVLVNISGGRIAKLNVTASVQNPHWKAFVGWIQGSFVLDDASGSTIYDWSLSTVGGEVYTTRQSGSITWASIECANSSVITAEETTLEHSGQDNISSTFSGTNVNPFVVAGTTISATDCSATNTYVDNVTQATEFEEVILYDTANIVYASILEEDEGGYDGNNYDFQMIVPENASSTWTGTTPYYLYVELS